MDGEGRRRLAARALAGGGDGWPQPPWKPNRRVVAYSYSICSRGSSSSSNTSTPGTSTPSPYTNTSSEGFTTPSPQSFHGLDLMSYRSSGGEGSEKKLEYIKYLLQEFCVAKRDVSILESWLSEIMGVRRRIVAADASATSLMQFAASWIRALTGITGSIRDTFLTGMLTTDVPEEDRPVSLVNSARFAETCILKMLPFVDALLDTNTSSCEIVVVSHGAPPAPADKLLPLIGVREAVSRASQDISLSFCSTSSEEAKRITEEMASLLSTKEAKLDEAIWSTMEEVRTRLLEDDDSSSWWGTQTQGIPSPDIHKVTRAIVSYIDLLSNHCPTVHQILHQAAQLRGDAPQIDSITPLANLMMETVSSLEQKLAEKSRSFSDQSMRFLFLINNSHFMWQQLYPTAASILEPHMSGLARKIDNYVETYLQLAWAPVLSCLYNSTPLCMGRYSSPAKFEAEFQRTYDCQKLWKVPDPKLRRRLRVAVIEKVVSNFSKYLEYNNISPSRITPQDLMDMLQELFEG